MMVTHLVIRGCHAGKFIRVDFHHMRKDGGLNASAKGSSWPLAVGDKVIAEDIFGGGFISATVRAVGLEARRGRGDVVLDLQGEAWGAP